MTHVRIQKFVDGKNTAPGQNVLATDLRQALLQESEELDLAIGSWRKASQASLGRKYAILPAVPYQNSLTQAGTHGHQRPGRIRLHNSLVQDSQILRRQLVQAPGGSDHIV